MALPPVLELVQKNDCVGQVMSWSFAFWMGFYLLIHMLCWTYVKTFSALSFFVACFIHTLKESAIGEWRKFFKVPMKRWTEGCLLLHIYALRVTAGSEGRTCHGHWLAFTVATPAVQLTLAVLLADSACTEHSLRDRRRTSWRQGIQYQSGFLARLGSWHPVAELDSRTASYTASRAN